MKINWLVVIEIAIVFCSIMAGWHGHAYFNKDPITPDTQGVWFENYNKPEVDNYTNYTDPNGRWICVNINNMTYERMLEVCKHEVGHEIFASEFEQMNDSKITKIFEGLR